MKVTNFTIKKKPCIRYEAYDARNKKAFPLFYVDFSINKERACP